MGTLIILILCSYGTIEFAATSKSEPVQQDNTSKLSIETLTPQTRPFQKVYVSPQELKDYLKNLSITYGIDYQNIFATVNCESGFDENAYNVGGDSYGPAQFIPSTWDWMNKIRGTNKDYLNPLHQLDMMAWAFSKDYQHHWDCWKMMQ